MTPYVMCQLCQFTDITDTVTRALIYPPSHFSALHVPMEAKENTPEQPHETVARLGDWMEAAEAVPDPPDQLLRKMDSEFSTAEAKALAPQFEVSERTIDNWISDLREAGKVEKVHRGYYRKSL